MALQDGYLDELTARSDIADVVGSYVNLNKRSGSNLFGLCPFHGEKTPSFSVSPEKQIYHCFGCGKGGGVINFIMEIEGLSFMDAVAFLAKRAGMPPPDDGTPNEVKNKRARLLELNKEAARFYYEMLSQPEGKAAVAYMEKRKITRPVAIRFGLGAAPDGWDYLLKAMRGKGFTEKEMFEAGLIKKSSKGSFYDTFRNRLMFPVIDVRGSVLGFSGRALGDNEPKYLNSPDTPVFNKSRNLFAINLAKKCQDGRFILCEGNVDVVSLHQAGFTGAVASLGTSLTQDQARLLSRYTDQIVLAYDGDNAGIKAAQRAIGIFEQVGMKVRVLRITGAKDPDEYIHSYGAAAFAQLLDDSPNQVDYQLAQIRARFQLEDEKSRVAYLNEAADFLSKRSNAVEREVYANRIAQETGISADAILLEAKKRSSRKAKQDKKKAERELMRPAQAIQPSGHELRYSDVVSAAAEEGIIRLLLLDPSLSPMTDVLGAEDFSSPFLYKAFRIVKKRIQENASLTPASLCNELEPQEAQHMSAVLQKPERASEAQRAMGDYMEKLKTQRLRRQGRLNPGALADLYRNKKGYGEH
ncbi:MAG: DNA primase [Oscillospiraceae bacterium]|nr:DNA primase [Oscillospiraceae bacterium]